jgi:hypothetical protein
MTRPAARARRKRGRRKAVAMLGMKISGLSDQEIAKLFGHNTRQRVRAFAPPPARAIHILSASHGTAFVCDWCAAGADGDPAVPRTPKREMRFWSRTR